MQEIKTGQLLKLKKDLCLELFKKKGTQPKVNVTPQDLPMWENGYSDPDDSDNYWALHPRLEFCPDDKLRTTQPSSFYLQMKKTELLDYFDPIAS